MWIDSHAHLNDKAFDDDYRSVIEAAVASKVEVIIVVGFDLASSELAVRLAVKEKMLWAAVGIHPHDAKYWDETAANRLAILLQNPKVVAVGEIGLDYYYDHSPRETQLKAFKEQLEFAGQYNKPVIIHNREAHQDTLKILQDFASGPDHKGLQISGVMHCFSGSYEVATQCLKLGLSISCAGPITFPNANKLREVVTKLPLSKLLIETDAPYLSPHPFRGKRNEPARVELIGTKLAEIKGLSVFKIMESTTANCKDLFKIP
jgi:TatD DNase family protein